MLQCPSCEQTQESGKFCSKCGTPVTEMKTGDGSTNNVQEEQVQEANQKETANHREEATTLEANSTANLNENVGNQAQETKGPDASHIQAQPQAAATNNAPPVQKQGSVNNTNDDIKQNLSRYWENTVHLLKNPSNAFKQGENHFIFGLIHLLLFPVSFALAIYFLINEIDKMSFGMLSMGAELSFPKIFMTSFMIILLLIAIPFACIVVFEKAMIKKLTFKTIVAQYGGLLTPLIILHILAMLSGFAGSIMLTIGILLISYFLASFIVSTLFIYEKVVFYRSHEQKVYIGIAMALVNLIITYVALRATAVKYLTEFADDFLGGGFF